VTGIDQNFVQVEVPAIAELSGTQPAQVAQKPSTNNLPAVNTFTAERHISQNDTTSEGKSGRNSIQRLIRRRSASRKSSPLSRTPAKPTESPVQNSTTSPGSTPETPTYNNEHRNEKADSLVEIISLSPSRHGQPMQHYHASITKHPRPDSFSQPRSGTSTPISALGGQYAPRSHHAYHHSGTSTPISAIGAPMVYQPSGSGVIDMYPTPDSETDTTSRERYASHASQYVKMPQYHAQEVRNFDLVANGIENALQAMR
jgi:hypothetical protein